MIRMIPIPAASAVCLILLPGWFGGEKWLKYFIYHFILVEFNRAVGSKHFVITNFNPLKRIK